MFYWVVKAILGPFLYLVWRPRAQGTRNVPRRGPAILVGNHLSFADHFFGPLPLPRKVTFLAKAEYFTGTGVKGLVSRMFFRGVGQVPIDRTGGRASEAALRTGLRVLAEGRLLGIYPEGTRAPDNRLYRGKTGVARLALESRAPVIPMAMINTFELMPSGRTLPRLRPRPEVRFGEPLDFSRYYGMAHDRAVLRAVTDEIMYAIMRLSGQEYVDRYASDVKNDPAAEEGTASAGDGGSRVPEADAGGPGEPEPAARGRDETGGPEERDAERVASNARARGATSGE
ncbi:lysophospholipid acyltransferase family protein [Actinoallomurus sp. NPDC050550]|uniref:lysophospholipid acyltransferase family protein n=1 Tax=Actinoallomurus sp. NPDC050550 TaxID=3154937 RepID=UPI0033D8BE24